MRAGFRGMPFAALCATLAAFLGACASDMQIHDAIVDVNRAFQTEYEKILAEDGTRTYPVPPKVAFAAAVRVMQRLGMRPADAAPDLGYLNVYAPAPAPLSAEEWRRASEADLPKLRSIAAQHVGMLSYFIGFEPEGLEIVINVTTLESSGGTEISLTTRMREVAAPRSGIPRREYPPPTGVRIALGKIWQEIGRAHV